MLLNNIEQRILEEFTKNKERRIYGRNIAIKFNLNQKSVSNNLNNLEKRGILKFTQEGKNKYYFLNENNTEIKEILKLIELHKKIEFLNKNTKLKELFKKLQESSTGILVVFGSYVKGTSKKDSDIDLLIIGKIMGLKDLEESFGVEINLINVDKNKFNLKEPLIKDVMENHIILKGVEEFADLVW